MNSSIASCVEPVPTAICFSDISILYNSFSNNEIAVLNSFSPNVEEYFPEEWNKSISDTIDSYASLSFSGALWFTHPPANEINSSVLIPKVLIYSGSAKCMISFTGDASRLSIFTFFDKLSKLFNGSKFFFFFDLKGFLVI